MCTKNNIQTHHKNKFQHFFNFYLKEDIFKYRKIYDNVLYTCIVFFKISEKFSKYSIQYKWYDYPIFSS